MQEQIYRKPRLRKRQYARRELTDYNQKAFGIVDPKELEVWTK